MVSYSELQSIYRLERGEPQLQKIEADFYHQVAQMVAEVEEKNRQDVQELVVNIYARRQEKIIRHALLTMDDAEEFPENIIEVEKRFYDEFFSLLNKHRKVVFAEFNKEKTAPAEGKKGEEVSERQTDMQEQQQNNAEEEPVESQVNEPEPPPTNTDFGAIHKTEGETEPSQGFEVIDQQQPAKTTNTTQNKQKVRVIKPIACCFMGADGSEYGPFAADEEIEIPPENVKILLQQGMVKEIEG